MAYVREGNQWTIWDDENSKTVLWTEVEKQQAYILLCERVEDNDYTSNLENEVAEKMKAVVIDERTMSDMIDSELTEGIEEENKGIKRKREINRNSRFRPKTMCPTKSKGIRLFNVIHRAIKDWRWKRDNQKVI